MKAIQTSFIILVLSTFLTACVGEFGEANVGNLNESNFGDLNRSANDDQNETRIEIAGAGIKGPLAFADAKLYQLDTKLPYFYNKNAPISIAMTNGSAQISGLSVPADIPPPYVMVIGGDFAVDLNTGKAPIISTLITVITKDMITAKLPIYATPLTTLAFYMASFAVPADGADFVQIMENNAANLIVDQFTINKSINIDLLRSPAVINDITVTVSEQEEAVYHRAAMEAFAAKVHQLSLSLDNVSTDSIIKYLAQDLQSDGVIDDSADGVTIGIIDPDILLQNPMEILIPNTQYSIGRVDQLMEAERILIGTDRGPVYYLDNISLERTVNINGGGSQFGPEIQTFIVSNPIIIKGEHDVVISGLKITNPYGPCIIIKGGASNIIIENNEIGPCGDEGIKIHKTKYVTIKNNYIHDTYRQGVLSDLSHYIDVTGNRIEDVASGAEFFANEGKGHISFTNNYVKNVSRKRDPISGNKSGGNIAMLAWINGPSIRINNNIGINIFGESNPEDLVNTLQSGGTTDDPLQVNNNRFIGGGPSLSGGGILLADHGGSNHIAENNILVNPGQYGMQIGGGHNNIIRNNKIYSDDQRKFTNVGIAVVNYADDNTQPRHSTCSGHTVENNEVTWWKGANHRNNNLPAGRNPYWVPRSGVDSCGTVAGISTNKFDYDSSQSANLDLSIWVQTWNNP